MMRLRQLMWPLIGLDFAVLSGMAFMAAAGAPSRFIIMNGAALVVANLVAVAPPLARKWLPVVSVVCVAGLMATLFSASNAFGVNRWVQAGPLTIHMGMLLLPALAVVVPSIAARTGAIALMAASIATYWQPDMAAALAILAVSAALVIKQHSRWTMLAFAVSLIAAVATMMRFDTLAPTPFVERFIQDAWRWNKAVGIIIFLSALAAVVAPLAVKGSAAMRNRAAALTACGAAFLAASFLHKLVIFGGYYPTPFVGFGASVIVGWGIALWLLRPLGDRSRV